MAEFDLFKTALDAGMAFTEMTRQRAEVIVRELRRNSEASREQTAKQVDELIERSRKNTEALVALIRGEIDNRLATLATRDDLARLAARIGVSLPFGAGDARPAAAKKAAAKKAPAKKAAAKKAAATKKAAPVKQAAAKKATAVNKAAKKV